MIRPAEGYRPPEVLKGLCNAVVRNYRGTITKGKEIGELVAFIGGVAANKGAVAPCARPLARRGASRPPAQDTDRNGRPTTLKPPDRQDRVEQPVKRDSHDASSRIPCE